MITNKKKLQSKSCHIDTCIKQYMLYEISFFYVSIAHFHFVILYTFMSTYKNYSWKCGNQVIQLRLIIMFVYTNLK